MRKIMTMFFCTAILITMLGKNVFAYDSKSNYFDGEVWHVSQSSASTCNIQMIALIENDYPGVEEIFRFEALDADFGQERTGSMIYEFYTDKNTAIGSVGGYNIYIKDIPIEPGTYDFNSLYEYEFVHNLSLDFNSIKQADPENFEKNVKTLSDGEAVVIYTMLGSEEWANRNMEDFENWAREREGVQTVSYKEIENMQEDTLAVSENNITPYDPDVTITQSDRPQDTQEEQKVDSYFPYIIKAAAALVLIFGACFIIKKRRQDR